jgi:hypothetical protein
MPAAEKGDGYVNEIQQARHDRVFDAYVGADGYLTEASFTAHTRTLAELRQEPADSPAITSLVDELRGWWSQISVAADTDQDGRITQDEYADWLTAIGLAADTDIATAFAGFDKNHDGVLAWEEFVECSRQFWMTFDPDVPGHRWIGP